MSFEWRNLCQRSECDLLRTTRLLGPPRQDAPCLRCREAAKNWLLEHERRFSVGSQWRDLELRF
jgi:hypothetical protein